MIVTVTVTSLVIRQRRLKVITMMVTMNSSLCLSVAALLFIGSLLSVVHAANEADLVTHLPGYQGNLPSKHYSGYIHTGDLSGQSGQLHYWFIESQNNPASDPGKVVYHDNTYVFVFIYLFLHSSMFHGDIMIYIYSP